MTTKREIQRCFQCGRKLTEKSGMIMDGTILEMSNTNTRFYDNGIPEGHESQGCFSFGTTCAKKVLDNDGKVDWEQKFKWEDR